MKQLSSIPNTLFIGQQVASEDFYGTLKDIPMEKRLEMPVAEEMQMGMCLGMAMNGILPVCIFQRMDFLLRAADQIGNHLAKWERIHGVKPHIIIRTTVGTNSPMDVGPQHSSDYTEVFQHLVPFRVISLRSESDVEYGYTYALYNKEPVMLIERQELYDTR